MGLTGSTNKTYLSISLGKIRKRATQDTPGAVSRESEKLGIVWELVYNCLEGILDNITFKDHEEYGKSWTLHIKDGDENYALQIQEDSRYGGDLLKKIPNLHKGHIYKVTPYDFTHNGKRKVGLSIKEGEVKIEGYYQEFTEGKDGWKVKNLHGFPEFDGDSKDKDDLKMYFMKVTKFLRPKALEHIQGAFNAVESLKEEFGAKPEEVEPDESPLPF